MHHHLCVRQSSDIVLALKRTMQAPQPTTPNHNVHHTTPHQTTTSIHQTIIYTKPHHTTPNHNLHHTTSHRMTRGAESCHAIVDLTLNGTLHFMCQNPLWQYSHALHQRSFCICLQYAVATDPACCAKTPPMMYNTVEIFSFSCRIALNPKYKP